MQQDYLIIFKSFLSFFSSIFSSNYVLVIAVDVAVVFVFAAVVIYHWLNLLQVYAPSRTVIVLAPEDV
jgi:hypothetical protein